MARPATLGVADVLKALRAYDFAHKKTTGAHEQWEGYVDDVRRIVTVDANEAPFTSRSRILRSMIRQSGIGKRDFYEAAGKPIQAKAKRKGKRSSKG